MTILCIAPNANIEHTWSIPGFYPGGVFRVQQNLLLASGKSINTARVARTLGVEAICMGFLAGHTGRQFVDLAEQEGLEGAWTWVQGETRTTVVIYDPQAPEKDATLISEAGTEITAGDWQRLSDSIAERAPGAQAVCFGGSLPPGTPRDAFAGAIRRIQALGCPVWVDCNEHGLDTAIESGSYGIKANGREIGATLGMEVQGEEGARLAAEKIRARGVTCVVVTLGARGALMVSPDGSYFAAPPRVQGVSSVGSGDAFMAGLLVGQSRGLDPLQTLGYATAAGAANTLKLGGGRLASEDFQRILPQVNVRRLKDA